MEAEEGTAERWRRARAGTEAGEEGGGGMAQAAVLALSSLRARSMNAEPAFAASFGSRGAAAGAEAAYTPAGVHPGPGFTGGSGAGAGGAAGPSTVRVVARPGASLRRVVTAADEATVSAIEPAARFKPSQFARTIFYELLPPGVNTLGVLLVETLCFGHTAAEALRSALARELTPVPIVGPLRRALKATAGSMMFAHGVYVATWCMFFSVVAVALSEEVRRDVEPLELLPLAMLYVSRALTISFKYSYLPDTYVNDKDGIMYTENFTAMTLSRQLVATAWIAPNKEGNTDMLMQEIEAASIVADVNLRGVRAEMGSKEAVAAVEAAAAGVGVAEGPRERPTTVSGVTLLAAIVDEAFGREIPVQWIVADFAGAVGLAFCQPICRAAVGVPAFGSSALGTAVCLAMSFAMWMMNFLNFGFLIFIFWDFRRRCAAVEALGDLVTHPGWSPEARHATGGERASKSDNPSAVHAAGGAPRAPAAVTLDLKHPDSCLCWLLVRRTLRQIGHIWGRRMNMYSVVFMVVALTCAAVLQVFFYGQLAFSHRFSSAVSLLYLVLVVSGLTVLVVLEASRLNDFSPAHRTLLRREAFAVAAQIANAPPAEAERLRASLEILREAEALVHHEEEVEAPAVVFGNIPASSAAISATAGVLLSMLLVAFQRFLTLVLERGFDYSGERGEFTNGSSES